MKHLRIGIAAIVAILAMSFTIASHEGAFKKTALNSRQAYVCVPQTDAFAVFDCTSNMVVPPNSPCSMAQKIILPGDCVFNMTPAAGQRVCTGGQIFCCAQLQPRGSCPLCQGNPGQAVINIWCFQ
jgi:hypothetical protein